MDGGTNSAICTFYVVVCKAYNNSNEKLDKK